MCAVCDFVADITQLRLYPPLAALGKDGLEVTFEEGAGVLEILFGVGLCGGDAVKRFVEDADDPLLFGRGGRSTSTLWSLFIVSVSTVAPFPLSS